MRFLTMHRHDPAHRGGRAPSTELIAKMGAFIGEHAERGEFLDGAGLGRSATPNPLWSSAAARGPSSRMSFHGENELPSRSSSSP